VDALDERVGESEEDGRRDAKEDEEVSHGREGF
jgi:hypothetical protein